MENYNKFSVEDFVQDIYFRKWSLGELSNNDTFWENWLQSNPEKMQMIEEAKSLVIALKVKELNIFTQTEISEGIQDILSETQQKSGNLKVISKNWLRIAASVALILGLGWWFLGNDAINNLMINDITKSNQKTIHINNGTQSMIFKLLDGSKITLEPNSELRYSNEFGKQKREVFLTGEAFFEVTKDAQKPFLIYTEKLVTKVVGTSFSIKAYKKDNSISVSVRTGKVTVYNQETKSINGKTISTEIVLIPNQKAVFEKNQELLIKTLVEKPVQLKDFASDTNMNFEGAKVAEVFYILEKMYGVKISFDKDVFNKCSITADIRNENLYQKLDLICEITQSKYEIVDGEILVNGKGCQ
jgi:transmembrane sensor